MFLFQNLVEAARRESLEEVKVRMAVSNLCDRIGFTGKERIILWYPQDSRLDLC